MKIPSIKETLSEMKLAHLKNIITHLDKEVSLFSKARLLDRIPQLLNNKEFLKDFVWGLNKESLTWLKIITIIQEYTPEGLYIIYTELKGGLLELYNDGLISLGDDGNKYLYIPKEIHTSLIDIFSSIGLEELEVKKEKGQKIGVGIALIRDIFLILHYTSGNQLKVAQSGEIYKRCYEDMKELLGDFRVVGGSIFDNKINRLQFLINFLSEKRILILDGDILKIQDINSEQWYQLSEFEKLSNLFLYFERNTIMRDMAYWFMKSTLSLLQRDKWYDIKEYIYFLSEKISQTNEMDKEDAIFILNEHLFSLYHFGFIKLSLTNSGNPKLFKTTNNFNSFISGNQGDFTVAETDEITIQSDFSFIVGRDVNLELRRELEKFLNIERVDEMIHYKMDKESVYKAMIDGVIIEDITGIIKRHSVKEPPQNVLYSLERWGSKFGRIKFYDGVIIYTESDEIGEEIKVLLENEDVDKEILNGRSMIIKRNEYERVSDMLKEMDYLPKPLEDESSGDDYSVPVTTNEELRRGELQNTLIALEKVIKEGVDIEVRVEGGNGWWQGWIKPLKLITVDGEDVLVFKRTDSITEEDEKVINLVYISW